MDFQVSSIKLEGHHIEEHNKQKFTYLTTNIDQDIIHTEMVTIQMKMPLNNTIIKLNNTEQQQKQQAMTSAQQEQQQQTEPLTSSSKLATTKNENNINTPSLSTQARIIFKKSHTCGSLFAKCHCDDNVEHSNSNENYTTSNESKVHLLNNKDNTNTTNYLFNYNQQTSNNKKHSNNLSEPVQYPVQNTFISNRSNSLDSFTITPTTPTPTICDEVNNNTIETRKNEKESSYPTLEHFAIAKICQDHPELCLKHPEFPFPIPPSDKKLSKLVNESTTSTGGGTTPPLKNISRSDDVNKRKIIESPPPLSLSQIFETRDYVPPFQDTFPKINLHSKSISKSEDDPANIYFKESGIIGPMGNGASTVIRKNSKNLTTSSTVTTDCTAMPVNTIRKNSKIMIENVKKRSSVMSEDYEYLKTVVPHLRKELQNWEDKAKCLENEIFEVREKLQRKDSEILKLQREIHKLKSVLQQTTLTQNGNDILTSLQERHGMANRLYKTQPGAVSVPSNISTSLKKQGVSAESSDSAQQEASEIQITRYDKDFRSKQLIKDAIMDNDFLKKLDACQVRELVDSMYQKDYEAGSYVIREGEAGAHLFVSANGEFEVIKDHVVLGKMGPGKAFGELAILYNCTRTASIRVIVDSKVWVLDRRVFQQIMMRTGLQRLQDNINFLRSVPLLRNLSNDVLAKIADVLEVEFYPSDAYIIRQGASGDTFFIISGGTVKVTQRAPGQTEEEDIRILQRGDYFGEQALLKEDCRTASVIALHPGVECLTLDRDSFIQLIGDLSELLEKDYGDEQRATTRPNSSLNVTAEIGQEYEHIQLDDLDVIATLGIGGFGRVELVQYAYDRNQTFALKCLKKQHIVDTHQQEHIYSEKNIMMNCRSPFICRLYKTFKDNKYVYMLLEACLGGEVWTILKDRSYFDDHTTRFITACVIEAFDYLHSKGIIYRDLKPENLLLDNKGYVKLVDFGFSKKIGFGKKTWTFCGTPEYVAPETILNKGHDRAVDYWALGILMHELLTGTPPFTASDPMKTYNIILKGIDMIDFPRHITRTAQSLIKRLCRDSPSERLGYQRGGIQDIKKHKWFQGFDWDGLKNKTMTPPIVQSVRGPCDTSNFEGFSKDNDIPPDELSNWDASF
ncbi:cGMP-dependent protein kinase, isozyme 1-like [Chrysoperla carnea]|uniref:cGMP-dependent protein kinase, isozyme 1-like n=1 Tax=Chrysoperla carnea TaxID=189513 RepID=UPI001D05D8A9|nr:cGMP-dependent protein kinase, isozyme 1-like [Chrysoperla carnea]XP_044737414.1 cGMP-dependent protein kinase, isozyme 1-like [Chrysoperla carnea]XP_044737415.1 cGMP-dependent protein kinase, isozyme 1-like [Chrysoperla carnea]